MSEKYRWAIKVVLHHEGGYVDHPDDPGGATHQGISLRFLRQNGVDIDGDGDVDSEDIKALVDDGKMVEQIYFDYFWIPNRLDEIMSEIVAVKIFDMAVNMGGRQAWKLVQRAVKSRVSIDGIVGPQTIRAVNSEIDEDYRLLARIRTEQADFYTNLARSRGELSVFLKGWLRRASL